MPPSRIIVLCTVLAAVFLAVDLLVPLGVALGVPHVLVILVAGQTRMPKVPLAFAALATLFIAVGWLWSPSVQASDPAFVASNRALAALVVWVVAATATLRLRAEMALRQSEERFRLAAAATNDAIWDTDLEAATVWWNEAYDRLFGRPRDTAGSWQWWIDRIHPEDRDRVLSSLYAARDGSAEQWTAEYRFRRPDGNWAFILDRCHIARNTSGQAVRILGAMQDLTERKRAVEALRENENRMAAFLENSAVIAWMKDEDGRHVLLSNNYQKRFNVKFDDWKGKTDFEIWPREIAEISRCNDLAVLNNGHTVEVKEEATNHDGSPSWWLNHKFLFQDASGKRYVGGLGVDITERKRAVEALTARVREQAAVAELGRHALAGADLETLFSEAVAHVADSLGGECAEVLELRPDSQNLLLRAGVG